MYSNIMNSECIVIQRLMYSEWAVISGVIYSKQVAIGNNCSDVEGVMLIADSF